MAASGRSTLRRWLWAAGILAGLVIAAVAVPFVVPLDRYLPRLTDAISQHIRQPVSIKNVRLEILPTPRVALYGIRIGRGAPMEIDKLELVPELASLLSKPRVIRLVRADGVRIREAALAMIAAIPKSSGGGPAPLRIERIVLRDARFEHPALSLPSFDARIDFGPGFTPGQAALVTAGKALQAHFEPRAGDVAHVALEARNWRLPVRVAPLELASLAAEGTLSRARLDLPRVKARAYGGTLDGSVRLEWSKGWRLSGKAGIEEVDLVPMLRDLGKPAKLSGRLDAHANFSAHASKGAQLLNALVLEGPSEVMGGAWHGVDLSHAAELPLGKLPQGGSTAFEELRGKVEVRSGTIRLTDICARSPTLAAGGRVEIAPGGALEGRLDVSVAKTGGFVGVPLALGGTVAQPSVGLTRGAAIGALLGTLVMPGAGTALGASAAGKLEAVSDCS